jgi:hypothetical protein
MKALGDAPSTFAGERAGENRPTIGERFFGAVGCGYATLGPDSLTALLDQRDALLEALIAVDRQAFCDCPALERSPHQPGCWVPLMRAAIAKATLSEPAHEGNGSTGERLPPTPSRAA